MLVLAALVATPLAVVTSPAAAATAPAPRVRSFAYAGTADPNQSLTATWSAARHHAPWVLTIHGGSWFSGSQAGVTDAVRLFYPRGWQVFNMSYRLGQDSVPGHPVTWAQQLADVVAARNWIRVHAGAFGIDPARGTAYGASAGGHLAATVGLMGGFAAVVSVAGVLQPQRVAIDASGVNPSEPSTPQMRWLAFREKVMMGCAYVSGTSPCARAWRAFEPESRIPATRLRGMYIIQGTRDPYVPPNSARAFAYHLGRAHIANRLYMAAGWGHTDVDLYHNATVTADMLRRVLAWSTPR